MPEALRFAILDPKHPDRLRTANTKHNGEVAFIRNRYHAPPTFKPTMLDGENEAFFPIGRRAVDIPYLNFTRQDDNRLAYLCRTGYL